MRKITEIILHCTATNAGREVTVKELDQWHRARGFDGCGYHFVVHLDGCVQCARPIEKKGAHCKGHNAQSIGICYVGGLRYGKPADTRTAMQRQSLIALCRALKYCVPDLKIYGHYEFANKACPCFDMDTFRKEVEEV